jgi:hypothetical protein
MRWNEDVAKKEKMCPITLRVAGERFQGYKCLGEECMEWRSSQPGEKENTGYCGMVGPPEVDS